VSGVTVVGAGLAGSEAAWQLAERGIPVRLFEARPTAATPAHRTADFAELVCSNSLGSSAVGSGHGLLVAELAACDSVVVRTAQQQAVAAGSALAVDRRRFAAAMTTALERHPDMFVVREALRRLPDAPAIVATGPLTLDELAADLARETGAVHLHFYDATSPIVEGDSIDRSVVFVADRRERGTGDYLNCPLTQEEYDRFLDALLAAELVTPHGFEDEKVFEGCMPIEQLARRGRETPRFGPMRPVGLRDPRDGRRPYAVVQLRREDTAGELWNLVGFQTRMTFGAQQRVLRLIPGLARAKFARFGVIHRNTYVDGPRVLSPDLSLARRPGVRLAGQITGVEGYLESVAMGLLAALFTAGEILGRPAPPPPDTTMLGALLRYVTTSGHAPLQPMNANFGLLTAPAERMARQARKQWLHERALADLREWRALLPPR
jgi:methylenetetrahydrofolate--tRNA-(uracil-5-)-methyltransferase